MFRWIAAIAVLILGLASLASAQPPFSAIFSYLSTGGLPLYTTCNGSTPVEDGRIIRVYQDIDNDGPDETDPQPDVCDVPPQCETGPVGSVNFNEFTMNGVGVGEGAGYFFTEIAFTSVGVIPANPSYYLRVYEPDGTTVLWTSTVKTLQTGPQDITWTRSEWTCGPAGPQCVVRDEHE